MHQELVELIVKHLPPSASVLKLLDVGGWFGIPLQERRHDIQPTVASLHTPNWDFSPHSFDAVVAYDTYLSDDLLASVLKVLRAGGRFIVIQPMQTVDETYVKLLEDASYVRILVEPLNHTSSGILIRGEKIHTTDDTHQRVEQVANADSDLLDLESYRGRYVHLLVRQTPNKPVWKLTPDEIIEWQAVTVVRDTTSYLLAFSSLPKAVSFMQTAVMQDFIRDINKVGKFSKETASTWTLPVLLNPTFETVQAYSVTLIDIDPETAEMPDE